VKTCNRGEEGGEKRGEKAFLFGKERGKRNVERGLRVPLGGEGVCVRQECEGGVQAGFWGEERGRLPEGPFSGGARVLHLLKSDGAKIPGGLSK